VYTPRAYEGEPMVMKWGLSRRLVRLGVLKLVLCRYCDHILGKVVEFVVMIRTARAAIINPTYG
jgi:hypothetical protein